MQYVKLTALPNTWFKEGTEVYDYDSRYREKKRYTLKEFEEWKPSNIILGRGIRVTESPLEGEDLIVGEEYEDGEACGIDEFKVEIVEE